jgi:hypothetical protein
MLVLGFYSGLSGRVRTVYLFSLCLVSLLSSRFTASALVLFPNFLKYLVFHFFISLSTVFIYRSSRNMWLFMYQGTFGLDRRVLNWKRWRISRLELEAVPRSWILQIVDINILIRYEFITGLNTNINNFVGFAISTSEAMSSSSAHLFGCSIDLTLPLWICGQ